MKQTQLLANARKSGEFLDNTSDVDRSYGIGSDRCRPGRRCFEYLKERAKDQIISEEAKVRKFQELLFGGLADCL